MSSSPSVQLKRFASLRPSDIESAAVWERYDHPEDAGAPISYRPCTAGGADLSEQEYLLQAHVHLATGEALPGLLLTQPGEPALPYIFAGDGHPASFHIEKPEDLSGVLFADLFREREDIFPIRVIVDTATGFTVEPMKVGGFTLSGVGREMSPLSVFGQAVSLGDRDAIAELYVRSREALRPFVTSKLGARSAEDDDVEERLSDSFVNTLEDLRRLKWDPNKGRLLSWLRTAIWHDILDRKKKLRRERGLQGDYADRQHDPSVHSMIEEEFRRIQGENSRLAEQVSDALRTMARKSPAQERIALILIYRGVMGNSAQETAAELEVKRAYVDSVYHRGKEMIANSTEFGESAWPRYLTHIEDMTTKVSRSRVLDMLNGGADLGCASSSNPIVRYSDSVALES